MSTRAQQRPNDEDELDLSALFARLRAGRWWIIGSVAVCTAVAVAAAFLMTPVYRASTILVPANSDKGMDVLGSALGQLGGLASIAGIGGGSRGSDTEESLAVLRSREFTERFIQEERLLPRLYASKWDAKAGTWSVPPQERPTPARAYRYFNQRIRSIDQDKKTGLITLQIDWKDRNEAADWANALARRLNEEMRSRATAKAAASLGYLEKELQSTNTVETREAISRLIESQVKQRMMANVTQEFAFRVVDKAMAPDADDPVKPQKLAMIAAGPFVGLTLGILWVLLIGWRREPSA